MTTSDEPQFAKREAFAPVVKKYRHVDYKGQRYRLQSLSAAEYGIYISLVKRETMKPAMILVSAVDEQGKRLFKNDELSAVLACDPELIEELFRETLNFKQPEAVEDIAKN